MNIILLSGGSGKRLWPLSNDVRSKQFLKLFRKADGTKESMVMRMYRMIKEMDSKAVVTIATSETQIPQIKAQIGEQVSISVEPSRRDTFPAIVLATAYLKAQGVNDDESVVVCPVDPYVEADYFECLKELYDEAGKANLTLMGIEPTYPSEKYGYIIPTTTSRVSSVMEFKEKPTTDVAKKYIEQGALWNGGVFSFRLGYILDIAKATFGTDSFDELYNNYESLPAISFDYAVVEKEESINVIRFNGKWKDIGTWNTLAEEMPETVSGNVTVRDCANTHIINELSIPLIAMGISDAVIAATPDGILISDKDSSARLKDLIASHRPMFEERMWGEYRILDYKLNKDGVNTLVKELVISPGQHISYQRHSYRTEIWTITEGKGELILDETTSSVSVGSVTVIPPLTRHAIKAITELHIIEVQMGDDLTEDDIERLDWDWKE